MKIRNSIEKLLTGRDLSEAESYEIFQRLFGQKFKKAESKALLLLLAQKSETADEALGCLRALRSLEPPVETGLSDLMDTCGTGGDGSHSLNVSTLAALVIAGAGGKVAKHGNRALSSRCGSSDLVEAFGVDLKTSRRRMIKSIRRNGIGYFHAPFYHPIFSRVQPLRRELKTRTIFNLMGPLANPLKIDRQMIGVSKACYIPLFAKVLQKMKIRTALVCHSHDGMDEISSNAVTDVAWLKNGRITYGRIHPRQFGFRPARKKDYIGGSVKKNRALALGILKGKIKGPLRDLVVINSAAGLVVAGKAQDLRQGIQLAGGALDSGRAFQALLRLKRLSRAR